MGIRAQLVLLVPGLVALALAGVATFAVGNERRDEFNDFRARNERVLRAISVTAAVLVAQNDLGGLDTLTAQLQQDLKAHDLLELAVVDDQGRVLAHSTSSLFNTVLDDPFTRAAIETEQVTWRRDGHQLRMSVPAVSGIRWATVEASFSLARLESNLRHSQQRWVAATLLLFALIGGIVFIGLDVLVVRPVHALQAAVRRMSDGHLATRVPPLKGRELGDLSKAMNGMAVALQFERDNLEHTVKERTRELQELNARLERLAVTDGLTGVYNHRRFQEALHTELLRCERHKRPLGVLMVDVDFFKRVNDAMGHPAGDELLRRLAEVLGADLRATDLIARYGGEEFAVILPETTKSEATQVGERMRQAVEQRINVGLPWLQKVTISVGVATYPEDGKDAEAVLEAADQAMYVAKRQGRNRVVGARNPLP